MIELDTIVLGDCLELLADTDLFPDDSVDAIITSPPYFHQRSYHGIGIGLADTSEPLDDYLNSLLDMFRHCLRIVKPTGSVVINLGDKYRDGSLLLVPYRFAIQVLEQFPVRLINDVTWVKSNPTPRQDLVKLMPATEPFFIFAKTGTYRFNKPEFLSVERKPVKVGANLGKEYHELIDTSDLDVEEKAQAHADLDATIQDVRDGHITGLRMKIRGIHALAYGGQDGGRNRQIMAKGYTIIRLHDEPIKRDVIRFEDVIERNVETIKGNQHPAVYPVALIEEFIRLLTPAGGIILDPFSGSGSSAVAAKNTGRHYIGIEIDPSYHLLSEKRLRGSYFYTMSGD